MGAQMVDIVMCHWYVCYYLQESFIKEALKPLLRLVTSVTAQFPSGHSVRSLIMYKLIDVLYILGLRLGFEMTRQHLTNSLQAFFKPFDHVYKDRVARQLSSHGSSGDLKDNPSTISLKSQGELDLFTVV